MKLSERQRSALVVISAQGITREYSVVLHRAVGGRVRTTLRSLQQRGLAQKDPGLDQAWSLTPAGRKLVEAYLPPK